MTEKSGIMDLVAFKGGPSERIARCRASIEALLERHANQVDPLVAEIRRALNKHCIVVPEAAREKLVNLVICVFVLIQRQVLRADQVQQFFTTSYQFDDQGGWSREVLWEAIKLVEACDEAQLEQAIYAGLLTVLNCADQAVSQKAAHTDLARGKWRDPQRAAVRAADVTEDRYGLLAFLKGKEQQIGSDA